MVLVRASSFFADLRRNIIVPCSLALSGRTLIFFFGLSFGVAVAGSLQILGKRLRDRWQSFRAAKQSERTQPQKKMTRSVTFQEPTESVTTTSGLLPSVTSHSSFIGTPRRSRKPLRTQLSLRGTESTKMAFYKLDKDGDGKISKDEFTTVCLEDLAFDLSKVELDRIFEKTDVDGDQSLSIQEFIGAVTGGAFFQNLKSAVLEGFDFDVPESFDYDQPTTSNYQGPQGEYFGDYADIRATRDYSYHVDYTQKRQAWQDVIIKRVVGRTERQVSPWVVFTCGPMGAGKGYALSWMSTHGFFPIEGMVHVDPDHFKRCMPEFKEYRHRGKEAGSMCHRESAFMQEIAQETALRTGQHVWVDGSLKDAAWFSLVFDDIRARFPSYRIAVFYVYASEAVVRERCDYRAQITGRAIPEHLMEASLREPRESLNMLTPKCDFVARINNEHAVPMLESVAVVNRSGCWSTIQNRFARLDKQPHEFPNFLAPMYLRIASDSLVAASHIQESLSTPHVTGHEEFLHLIIDASALNGDCSRSKVLDILQPTTSFTMVASAFGAITLPPDVRKAAGIPASAFSFAWINRWCMSDDDDAKSVIRRDSTGRSTAPAARDGSNWLGRLGKLPDDEELSLILKYGAFAYFDENCTLLQLSLAAQSHTDHALQFGPCEDLPEEVVEKLHDQKRWWPPLFGYLSERGVIGCCWIRPGERLGGKLFPPHGAFAYAFQPPVDGQQQKPVYFAVMD